MGCDLEIAYLQSLIADNDGAEINPSNYNHNDVGYLNDSYVNLIIGIEKLITILEQKRENLK